MTIYYIFPADGSDAIETSLKEAKKYLREHPDATGQKVHVGRDGEWEPVGPIVTSGSNAYRLHNGTGRDRMVAAY